MGKKVREYKSGDFIFAKVKGYPAWPARVQRNNGKKYFVYFYGTGETANLPPNMIFDYAENKDKFLSKSVKRKDFNDGVRQIENDFANNVPLEDVIGAVAELPVEDLAADQTADESAVNDTIDESVADTTVADETIAGDTTANATQAEGGIEDSDEAGTLVIDEGKKGRKSNKPEAVKTPAKLKEPKTPRGRPKKDDPKEDEKSAEVSDEIISRSGRKIRPKRYIDEQTEENTTLPSPAPKKRKASPAPAEKDTEAKETEKNKQYNAVSQSELEDLKQPFKPEDEEKDNILIAYLPDGQYVGIKLTELRSGGKTEAAKLARDKSAAAAAITLKSQLEKGHITPLSVSTQLVMDLNLTDEEKATLDKEREIEEKKSRVQFLKTEMKLIELDAKIKTCLSLEKADTELCLKLLEELSALEAAPLMLLKHPACLETVKRLRAYVGNTPSWELSEADATTFRKQAHHIRKHADQLYNYFKNLFTTPDGLSFWEYFSERVLQFKKATAKLNADELLEMVHEPLEMTVPTSHTMKAAIDAANAMEANEQDPTPKKRGTPAKSKKAVNNTPTKPALKRQSSRKQEEKEKEKEANKKSEQQNKKPQESNKKTEESNKKTEEANKKTEESNKKTEEANKKTEESNKKTEESNKKSEESNKKSEESNEKSEEANNKPEEPEKQSEENSANSAVEPEEDDNAADSEKSKETEKSDQKESNSSNKEKEDETSEETTTETDTAEKPEAEVEEKNDTTQTETAGDDETGKASGDSKADEKKEVKSNDKAEMDEPRAKRSRESKKTETAVPRSPAKRKAKS